MVEPAMGMTLPVSYTASHTPQPCRQDQGKEDALPLCRRDRLEEGIRGCLHKAIKQERQGWNQGAGLMIYNPVLLPRGCAASGTQTEHLGRLF